MALRAVLQHPKLARLKGLLGLALYAALGCLESLWHFAARYAPQGDVGKFSDAEIEAWVGWDGEPGAYVAAMIESRWLDRSEEFRLVVHDWSDHADEYVHTDLARKCLLFADGTVPSNRRLNQRERNVFTKWLKAEGLEKRPVGRPVNKCRRNADSLRGNAAEMTKPEPEPEVLELTLLSPEATSVIRPEEFGNIWNRNRGTLPKIDDFPESRKKKVQTRIKEGLTYERFTQAVKCCTEKPFLRGEKGWQATFDWLVENDTNIGKAINEYNGSSTANGAAPKPKLRIPTAPLTGPLGM